jgi:hypothetical protein
MMAVEGIGNFLQDPADPFLGQTPSTPVKVNVLLPGIAGNAPVTEDSFTPSSQNNPLLSTLPVARPFQATRGDHRPVAANILFASKAPNASQTGAPAQGVFEATAIAGNVLPAAVTNSRAPVVAGQLFPPPPAAQVTAARAAATTDAQEKIQALNDALPALGLSKEEIQEIDHIAAQIQNFNPAAYASLITQFEAETQQATQQGAPDVPTNSDAPASKNTAGITKANGGGPQIYSYID